ncbi:DNA alkylation repair protein [Ornithinibacillus halotolerans]|nr:DNA alkylation repair protein [Ornithinibacillus halotolerans]
MMIHKLVKELEANRNLENAIPMEKYMKDHFTFLGIKTPERKKITNQFFKDTGIIKEAFDRDFILQLWAMDEREYQYIALDYIDKMLRKINVEDLALFEELIVTKSWWDTVDMLAQKPVGKIASIDSRVISDTIDSWSVHDNLWLIRTAILFQLKYKEKTNEDILYTYIIRNAESKEFFIQKAIGWALREYSKINPTSVRYFIENTKLAKLSIREGSKYL